MNPFGLPSYKEKTEKHKQTIYDHIKQVFYHKHTRI